MDNNLIKITKEVYHKCGFEVSDYKTEREGAAYDASRFTLNGKNIVSRSGKITPKKAGQFVTFWKRQVGGPTEPINKADGVDYYVVNVLYGNRSGQFVFSESILIEKGIMATKAKEGKRGFRVYPIWDEVLNNQAKQTQKWQLDYFYEVNESTDLNKVIELYKNN